MPNETLKVRIGGTIDRMDYKDGTLRIIDYKTGGQLPTGGTMEEKVFTGKQRDGRIFQTFVYASIICGKQKELKVSPRLMVIPKIGSKDFRTEIKINENKILDFSLIDQDFRNRLCKLLVEIFTPDIPFKQNDNRPDSCRYCDYRNLCKISVNPF